VLWRIEEEGRPASCSGTWMRRGGRLRTLARERGGAARRSDRPLEGRRQRRGMAGSNNFGS
jgi:hypothetical protein